MIEKPATTTKKQISSKDSKKLVVVKIDKSIDDEKLEKPTVQPAAKERTRKEFQKLGKKEKFEQSIIAASETDQFIVSQASIQNRHRPNS